MAEERKHVQKSPLSHILSLPSVSKKRTFSEKRIDKPELKPDPGPVPQSAPPSTVLAPDTISGPDQDVVAAKAEPNGSRDESTQGAPLQPAIEEKTEPQSAYEEGPEKAPQQAEQADIGESSESRDDNESNLDQAEVQEGDREGQDEKAHEDAVHQDQDQEAQQNRELQSDSPSPPTKKIKIDSSKVIDSVAGFKRYLSSVVVYVPGQSPLDGLEDRLNSIVWVRIPRRYITRSNPGVVRRKVWGTDVYTDDSDIVACLYHSGYLDPESEDEKTRKIATGESDLLVGIIMLPKLKKYTGCYLNELNSRSWGSHHDGASFKINSVVELPRGSAEFPACETVDRALSWSSSYLIQKNVRESLRF